MAEKSRYPELTIMRLFKALRGRRCPACGSGKKSGFTFCARCFYTLGYHSRSFLNKAKARDYGRAVEQALTELQVEPGSVTLPEAKQHQSERDGEGAGD